jgi:Tat protein secretion system quality control protein TatD with DNase activity
MSNTDHQQKPAQVNAFAKKVAHWNEMTKKQTNELIESNFSYNS